MPSATEDGAKTGQSPASGGLADLSYTTMDSWFDMNFRQDEWMTSLDEKQCNPDFDLETHFLTMTDDLNDIDSGEQDIFDPVQMI